MKTTATGCRVSKNGKPLTSIEKDALVKDQHQGNAIKEDGIYYFFSRKQGNKYIYLS